MYDVGIKQAENFVNLLVENNISIEFLRAILEDRYLLTEELRDLKENIGILRSSTDIKKPYSEEKKSLIKFINENLKGSKIDFSNSLYCFTNFFQNEKNREIKNHYVVLPFGKVSCILGFFLEKLYSLIVGENNDLSSSISLSRREISCDEHIEIFTDIINKVSETKIDHRKRSDIDFNIHHKFNKLKNFEKNEIISYFLRNYPEILSKYFEINLNHIGNIEQFSFSNVSEIVDRIDSPCYMLLKSDIIYIERNLFEKRKIYIKYLITERIKNI
ncbi:MAG: hypothetical protein QXF12_01185 [Candidatus Aenigmatarchaeota archaeon]